MTAVTDSKPIEYFRAVPCKVRCIDNVNFEGVLEAGGEYSVVGVYTLGRELFVDLAEGGGWSASRFADVKDTA